MSESNVRIPEYRLNEAEDEIKIIILAPLAKPNEGNFLLDRQVFTFISNPYFLKIKLPHPVFNAIEEQSFDSSSNTYTIKLKKQIYLNEACEESNTDAVTSSNESKGDGTSLQDEHRQYYGFANKYSKMFGKLADAFSDVVNLPNPDTTPVELRRELRLQEEDSKWNDDHYLADTMETDHLESIFNYEPSWVKSPIKELNDDMKDLLMSCKSFSNTKFSPECVKLIEFQMIDILFGYAYDKRINEGDSCVESGWTINKLSSTLSWFEVFDDFKSLLLSCYRRSLTYPLYRNWKLTQLVHSDVARILQNGSAEVAQSLLEVKEIFNDSENRYLLNTLYVNNLCWYSYHVTNERLLDLSKELTGIKVEKFEVNSDLPLLEVAAHLTLKEETEGGDEESGDVTKIVRQIGKLTFEKEETSTGEDSSTEDSDSEGDSISSQSSDKGN